MLDIAVQLCESDIPEILRYLEYHGQEMDDNLKKQIQRALSIEDTLTLGLTYAK